MTSAITKAVVWSRRQSCFSRMVWE